MKAPTIMSVGFDRSTFSIVSMRKNSSARLLKELVPACDEIRRFSFILFTKMLEHLLSILIFDSSAPKLRAPCDLNISYGV